MDKRNVYNIMLNGSQQASDNEFLAQVYLNWKIISYEKLYYGLQLDV